MNWQPIETAPKETALLLATEFFGAGDWRIKCGSFYGGEWHVWGASWMPSHWMPLPAAPGEECRTCSGHGAVGNILTAEPCPDCTPVAALEAPSAPAVPVDPLDALRWGANVAETLLSIGESIGFGRAQQILGEQWEAKHDCAPRGRMGVTAKDTAALASKESP